MGNKLYVGNLPYAFRDNDLEQAFSQFGSVPTVAATAVALVAATATNSSAQVH